MLDNFIKDKKSTKEKFVENRDDRVAHNCHVRPGQRFESKKNQRIKKARKNKVSKRKKKAKKKEKE